MPDSIVFRCTNCKKAYKVGGRHAGRNFRCTNCQAHIVVPNTSTNSGRQVPVPEFFAPEVDMDAGNEVVFKQTDSQRRASIAPTRVFSRQRETGLAQPAEVKTGGGKGALIAVVLAVVVVGGGAAAFFLMNGSPDTNNAPTVADNTGTKVKSPIGNDHELRDKLLEESSKSDVTPARLLKILTEAHTAKLARSVIAELTDRAVAKIYAENGSGVPNAKIFVFAGDLEDADKQSDANQMYSVIVGKESDNNTQTDDLKRAHKKLGNAYFDFAKSKELVKELLPWSSFLELDDIPSRLAALTKKTKDGWMKQNDYVASSSFEAELVDKKEVLDSLIKESPYLWVSAPVKTAFKKTRLGKTRDWNVTAIEPIVCISETSIDEDKIVELIDKMLQALAFYKKEFVEPLDLKRLQPANLTTQGERNSAPFVIFLFDDYATWNKYLRENTTAGREAEEFNWFTEYDTGRLSSCLPYNGKTERSILTAFNILFIDHYLPSVPTKRMPRGIPNRFTNYVMKSGFTSSFEATSSRENEEGELVPNYFSGLANSRENMVEKRKPFKWNGSGTTGYGGPLVTVKQMVASKSDLEMIEFVFKNVSGYGWNEDGIEWIKKEFAPDTWSTWVMTNMYTREFIAFLFSYKESGQRKYNEKFLEWYKAELDGELSDDNQVEVFSRIFEIKDDKGWAEIDKDFGTWIEQD